MLISLGPSAASGPVSTGGAAGVGIADLTACSNGLSLTSAISSGPIVSTVVVSTSVPTPAAPISAPISVPPVSAPGDSNEVSSSLVPACAEAPAVISALGVATVPPCLPSSVLVTVPGTVPGLSITSNIIPEASVNVVPGIIPVSAAPCVILGVSAGAGQESVTAAVPTAVRKSYFHHLHGIEHAQILIVTTLFVSLINTPAHTEYFKADTFLISY